MWWLTVPLVTVYLGFYLVIVFLTLGIACALFYLAELIEEYSNYTRKILLLVVKLEFVLHLLLLTDRPPLTAVLCGLVAHALYYRLLRRFPYNRLGDPDCLAAGGLFALSCWLWWCHFSAAFHTTEFILAFLLVSTCIVPFGILLGVTGDVGVLPGTAAPTSAFPTPFPSPSRAPSYLGGPAFSPTRRPGSPTKMPSGAAAAAAAAGSVPSSARASARGATGPAGRRRGLALRVFDALRRKRDGVLPDVIRGLPGVGKDKQ